MNARLPVTRLIAESVGRPSGKIVRRKPLAFALEPRIMFDGAAVDTAVAVIDAPPPADTADTVAADTSHTETATVESTPTDAPAPDAAAPVVLREADPALNNGRREAVFIDTSLADYQVLVDAVRPGVEIVLIDGSRDGLAQMAAWAETHSGYDSLAIVGHGTEGMQKIGATAINSATLADENARAELQTIGAALTAEGDIALYGCSVAAGETGQQFVNDFAALTGADVAASSDITGQGGNWNFEYSSGFVDISELAFDATNVQAYTHDLLTINAGGTTAFEAYQSGNKLVGYFTWIRIDSQDITAGQIGLSFSYEGGAYGTWQSVGISLAGWATAGWIGSISAEFNGPPAAGTKYIGGALWFCGGNPPATVAYTSNATGVGLTYGGGGVSGGTQVSGATSINVVYNAAPSFIGGNSQSLSLSVDAAATDLKSYLHVSDSDTSQTETWSQSSAPSHGTLNITGATASSGSTDITPGGTITYTPTAGYTGTDTFSIQVSDEQTGGTATKTFTVTVNDAPTISGAAAGQAVNDNATVTPFAGVTIADTGANQQTQTVSVTLDSAAKGSFTTLNGFTDAGGGVYTFSGTAAAATTAIRGLVFNPADNRVAPGSTETTTFTISTNDGVASAVTSNTTTAVSTSVNDAPTNIALSGSSINENTAAGTAVGTLSTTDADTGQTYTYSLVGGDTSKFQISGSTLQGAGNLDYETAASHNITIRSTDSSGAYYDKSFAITVGNINDAPTLSGLDAATFAENTVNAAAQIIDSAVVVGDLDSADFNGGSLTASWTGGAAQDQLTVATVGLISVSGGTVSYNGNAIGTVAGGSNGASLTVSFNSANATPAAVQALIQALKYQNTSDNPTASRTLSITVSDGDGATSTAATAVITVTAENDAPTAGNATLSATEDTQYTFTAANFNFADVDTGNTLQSVQIVALPAKGSLTLSGGAVQAGDSITVANIAAGNLKWSPVAHENGNGYTSFTFKVGDGTTASASSYTATFNVTAVNDAPTDIAISASTVAENSAAGTAVGNLSSTDVDIATNGQTHTYSIVGGASDKFQISGGQLQVKAGANLDYETATSHSVTIRTSDGNGGTFDKTFTIGVSNVNDPPTVTINQALIVTQGTTGTINSTRLVSYDGEQAANALTYTLGTAPLRGTLYKSGVALSAGGTFTQADVNNGLVTYSHNIANAQATDSFTFSVADGVSGSTALTTFNITVNRHPTVTGIADTAWNGTGNKTYQFSAFTDADADTLSYSAKLTSGAALPSWLSFTSGTRTFSGNPPAGVGSLDIRVTASDGKGGTATDDFTLTITGANDTATVAATIPDQTWTGSGAKSYQVPAGTFSADPDGDAQSYSATLSGGGALPSWLTFNAATRSFSGNPPVGTAFHDITVTASDGNGGNVSDTFRLTLNSVNDAPVVVNPLQPQTASGPGVWSYTVPANTFSDADNDTLSWSATRVDGSALPAWLSFNNGTLVLSGNAPNNLPQVDIKVTVTDGNGGSAASSFLLTIDQSTSNDTPAVSNVIPDATWTGSGSQQYQVPANTFADADGDTLSLSATLSGGGALPGWLGFNPANWTFSGNPPATVNGQTFAITVTANDNEGGTITDTFNLTIANANDTPTLANGIADQSHSGSGLWTYQVPANTFADADAGDGFSYAATQADGSALPAWLSFDATTRSFSGNPPNGVSSVLLKVTATDNFAASVFSTFTLRIDSQNDAPLLANPIPAQHMSGPGAWSYTVAANTFSDADSSDTLTWSASQADDSALPTWLSFNATTREFSGNPPWGAPSIALKVAVDDGNGGTAYSSFLLTVDQATTNDTPHVVNALANQTWTGGGNFTWQVPANTFADADGEALTLSATQTGGAVLPSWLSFNAGTWSFTGNPPNGVTSVPITVTARDAQNAAITSVFTLTIVSPNDTPTVANGLTDQSHSGAGSWSYTVPANTFADADVGDTLAWSATQADGAALPSWLTFNTSTRSFGGNPPNNLPSIALKVTGTDSQGATVGSSFTLAIAGANDTPVAGSIANQSHSGTGDWTYQVPANTFSDADSGDTLTHVAAQSDGSPLPSWLSFNASTRTFSGNPPNNLVSIGLKVSASDNMGASAFSTFTLSIANANDTPTVTNPIPDQSHAGAGAWSYTVPADSFNDTDVGDTLAYTVYLADGSVLPAWLSFDAGSRTFSGNPPAGNTTLNLRVTASDNKGSHASDDFVLTVTNGNDVATVANAIPDQTWSGSGSKSYQVPANTFSLDPDGDALGYSATLSGGGALPSWLTFNTATRTFSGNPPSGTAFHDITVTAADGNGGSAADTFRLNLNAVNDAPIVLNPLPAQYLAAPGAWNYAMPANTFSDADGDTLTWSATRVDGSALPAWLSFDANTRTLSGTVPGGTPALDIRIGADDGAGGSATSSFLLTVDQGTRGNAPTLATAIADVTWSGAGSHQTQLPGNTFSDADGDRLTLTTKLSDGSVLPTWMTFNPVNWTFSGNPPATANGQTYVITVTADDSEGGSITDTFNLTIANANDTPTLANGIADQSHSGSGVWAYQVPANTFVDADAGDGLSYAATQADGSALPAWLSFDTTTRSFSGNPPNGLASIALKVTATDGGNASEIAVFTLRVTQANDAPILANPVPPQHLASAGAWNYTVPANTFIDADNDTLTWSATQANGAQLPDWLTFNPTSRTFSGIVPAGLPGIALKVGVVDGHGGENNTAFAFTIGQGSSSNLPVVSTALANQTWTGGGNFTWQVPANTFADGDGDALTLSATQTGGAVLPSWLTFNAGTWSFTGNPPNGVTSVPITVTARDAQNAAITSAFTLTIVSPNDTPTVANGLTDQSHNGAGNWSYTVPANTFADADVGDTLAWSATQADGAALPSWLSFDATTRTFGGNPPNNLPSIALKVTGTDSQGAMVSSSFTLAIVSANDTPTLANALANQSTTSNVPITYQFAANSFADNDVGDSFTYRAKLTTGAALPAWLRFDPATRTFAIAPGGADFGDFHIRVTAADSQGAEVTGDFLLHVDPMPPPTAPQPPAPTPIPSGTDGGGGGTPSGTPTEGPLPPDSPLAPILELLMSPGGGDGGGLGSGTGLGGLLGMGGFGFGGSPSLGSFWDAPVVIAVPGELGGAGRGGNAPISASFTAPGDGAFRVPVMKAEQPALLPFRPIPDVTFPAGAAPAFVSFSVPPDSFVHTNPGAVINLQASLADGRPLPAWLSFDPGSGKFEGRPPAGFEGVLLIKIIARDAEGREAATLIRVSLRGETERLGPQRQGRSGLSEQIRQASARHRGERFGILQKPALAARRVA